MSNSEIQALVIMDESGIVLDLGVMNPKAFQKSLENKILWVVHEETERVLPYREEAGEQRIMKIEKAPFGYMVFLAGTVEGSASGSVSKPRVDPGTLDEDPSAEIRGGASGVTGKTTPGDGIIGRLAEVIARRHSEMPEGSYTTHLFTKGADKIRKKLGEEAVEVILAREKSEVIYESADLIYHLLVLLESLDISIEDVFAELEGRE